MSAKNYTIGLSAITNTVYIHKKMKDPHTMGDDKKALTKQEVISTFLDWVKGEIDDPNEKTLTITAGGMPFVQITFLEPTP